MWLLSWQCYLLQGGSRRVREGGRCRWSDSPCVHAVSNATLRWLSLLCGSEGQFSGNSTQKDCWEHCKTLRWQCWFSGSQPQLRSKFGGHNSTNMVYSWLKSQHLKGGGSLWAQISRNGALPTNGCWRQKTKVPGLSRSVVCVSLGLAILNPSHKCYGHCKKISSAAKSCNFCF